MVGAEHPLIVGEGLLKQRDRHGDPPRSLVGNREDSVVFADACRSRAWTLFTSAPSGG